MKSPIKVAEIRQGLATINQYRITYSRKASEKIRELNLRTFFIHMLDENTKNKPPQFHDTAKPSTDPLGISDVKRSKFYRFRMEVKTMLYKAYELD